MKALGVTEKCLDGRALAGALRSPLPEVAVIYERASALKTNGINWLDACLWHKPLPGIRLSNNALVCTVCTQECWHRDLLQEHS